MHRFVHWQPHIFMANFFFQYPQPQPMTIEHDIHGRNEESENEIDERRTQKKNENGRGKNARTLNPFDMQTSPQHVIYRSLLCVCLCLCVPLNFFLLLVLWSYFSKLQYISLYFLYSFFGLVERARYSVTAAYANCANAKE